MNEPNPFENLSSVDVSWIVDDKDAYVYRLEAGSLAVDPALSSVRFRLVEVNGRDDSFEVILVNRDGSFFARFSYPGLEGVDYALSYCKTPDGSLFYLLNRRSKLYIHLS